MVGLRDKKMIFAFLDEALSTRGMDYPVEYDLHNFMQGLGYNTTDAQVDELVREYLEE